MNANPDGGAEPPAPSDRGPAAARRRLVLGVVPAVLLFGIGIWEMVAAGRAGHDVPGPEAWEEAARVVREQHRPGELIVFAPPWLDPVGRMHLGDRIPVDMAARMDDARYGVAWEVSIRGAEAAEARGREVTWEQKVAGIRIRKLEKQSVRVVTDLVGAFAGAKVEGRAVGRPQVVLAEVGFAPHRCVQVQPWPDATVHIRYGKVRLGSLLVGYAGLADVFTRRDVRDPGVLEVLVDGTSVAKVTLGVDDGWVGFAAETTPKDGAEIEVRATAVGKTAQKRLICFAAEARE